jgi:hypothetical protein
MEMGIRRPVDNRGWGRKQRESREKDECLQEKMVDRKSVNRKDRNAVNIRRDDATRKEEVEEGR